MDEVATAGTAVPMAIDNTDADDMLVEHTGGAVSAVEVLQPTNGNEGEPQSPCGRRVCPFEQCSGGSVLSMTDPEPSPIRGSVDETTAVQSNPPLDSIHGSSLNSSSINTNLPEAPNAPQGPARVMDTLWTTPCSMASMASVLAEHV